MKFKINENFEQLQRRAYDALVIENRDISKIDKIIDGIEKGTINKDNLYDAVRKFTRQVTSDHAIRRWEIITEWFANEEWFR